MAHYDVTLSCGHTETKSLFGPEAGRQRWLRWAEANASCAACSADDATQQLASLEVEHNLPTLTGSDKQVAWARDVRGKGIGKLLAYFDETRRRVPADKLDTFEAQASVYLVDVASQSAAKWWIDARELDGPALIGRARGK